MCSIDVALGGVTCSERLLGTALTGCWLGVESENLFPKCGSFPEFVCVCVWVDSGAALGISASTVSVAVKPGESGFALLTCVTYV
jgi:hypothetical protein